MLTFIVFMIALIVGCLLGYQMGGDKRILLEIELKHLRAARDSALKDSDLWRKLYQKKQSLESGDKPDA